ncbi:hypothetical protein [Pseudoalteromonas xiamenensis]
MREYLFRAFAAVLILLSALVTFAEFEQIGSTFFLCMIIFFYAPLSIFILGGNALLKRFVYFNVFAKTTKENLSLK